jgi:hypothetical protein
MKRFHKLLLMVCALIEIIRINDSAVGMPEIDKLDEK